MHTSSLRPSPLHKLAVTTGLLVAFIGGSALSLTQPQSAHAEADQSMSVCIQDTKSLSVLFLVDTSLSLKKTDARNERVAAIQSALSALGALQSASNVKVQTEFLEFGTTTRRAFPADPEWGPLSGDPAVQTSLAAAFADRNKSEDTDYVSALEPWVDRTAKPPDEVGAIEMLERAPANSCRLLVWFTDGQFSLDYFNAPKSIHWTDPPTEIRSDADGRALEPAALARICEPNGLADQLRAGTDITGGARAQIAIVALDNGGTPNFDLINSIASGQGPAGSCGTNPARGSFVSARNIGDLALQLREAVLGPSHGPTDGVTSCVVQSGQRTCSFDPNDVTVQEYDYPFDLSTGLTGFNLLTLSADRSVETLLVAPDGQQYALGETGDVTLNNGVLIHVRRLDIADGGYLLDAKLPSTPTWAGKWRVRYRTADKDAASRLNKASIYVFGGLEARLANTDVPLRKGRDGKITVELVSAAGEPATNTAFAAGSVIDLQVNGQPVATPTVNADGTLVIPYTVPAGFDGDNLVVTGSLRPAVKLAPTAPTVQLAPWSGELGRLTVKDIPKYPLIEAPEPFGLVINQDQRVITTRMHLDAMAPESGGCVALTSMKPPEAGGEPIDVEVRVFDGDQEITVGTECAIRLPSGTERYLTVEISAPKLTVDRSVRVSTGVVLNSTSELDASQTETFSLDLGAAIDPIYIPGTSDTVWFLMLLAILVPILLLYAVNIIGARLDVGRMTFAEFPVRLVGGQVRRVVNGQPAALALKDDDIRLTPVAEEGRHRSVNVATTTLRGKWSKNPFADVYGQAEAQGTPLVVANRRTDKGGHEGRLDASLSGAWVFRANDVPRRASDDLQPLDGTLTLVIPPFPAAAKEQLLGQVEEISDRVDRAARTHAVDEAQVVDEAPHVQGATTGGHTGADDARVLPGRVTSTATSEWDDVPSSADETNAARPSAPPKADRKRDRKRKDTPDITPGVPTSQPDDDLPF